MFITKGLRPAERILGALVLAKLAGRDMRANSPYPWGDHLRVKKHRHNHTGHAQQSARLIKNRFV